MLVNICFVLKRKRILLGKGFSIKCGAVSISKQEMDLNYLYLLSQVRPTY